MFGHLYERALDGERCWVRHDDGRVDTLPVQSWLGGPAPTAHFDEAVVGHVRRADHRSGLRPGRLVAHLVQPRRPALGVDLSPAADRPGPRAAAPGVAPRCLRSAAGTGSLARRSCSPTATSAWAATPGGCCAGPPSCCAGWPLRRRIRFRRDGCQRRLGAAGIRRSHRPVVPVGIGGHRLCATAGRRSRPDDRRDAPDRPTVVATPGGDMKTVTAARHGGHRARGAWRWASRLRSVS